MNTKPPILFRFWLQEGRGIFWEKAQISMRNKASFLQERQSRFFVTLFEMFTTQRSNVSIRESQSINPFYPVLEMS